jgi:hypothetical protein
MALASDAKDMKKHSSMNLFTLRTPELRFGDWLVHGDGYQGRFSLAWAAWVSWSASRWTRGIWHLPLFFVALAVFLRCMSGLILRREDLASSSRYLRDDRPAIIATVVLFGDIRRSPGRADTQSESQRVVGIALRWLDRSFKSLSKTTRP